MSTAFRTALIRFAAASGPDPLVSFVVPNSGTVYALTKRKLSKAAEFAPAKVPDAA